MCDQKKIFLSYFSNKTTIPADNSKTMKHLSLSGLDEVSYNWFRENLAQSLAISESMI